MKPADSIDSFFAGYTDWRGQRLQQLRQLITATEPDLSLELKWDVPVWSHHGPVCAVSGFKDHVKINFFKGARLSDPHGLFNSGLDSKSHRSINFSETDNIDTAGLQDFIRQAVALNQP